MPTLPRALSQRLLMPNITTQAPLFSGLPKPAAKKKLVVQFRCPITFNAADVKEDLEQVWDPRKICSWALRGQGCLSTGDGVACAAHPQPSPAARCSSP